MTDGIRSTQISIGCTQILKHLKHPMIDSGFRGVPLSHAWKLGASSGLATCRKFRRLREFGPFWKGCV